jgi:hypothetical protein
MTMQTGALQYVMQTTAWPYRERLPRAPMEGVEVVRLLVVLEASGIEVWLDGGWGVDALLEEEVREHDDLDLVVALADAERLIATLRAVGYEHVAGCPPMSFVLVDPAGRQVDAQVLAHRGYNLTRRTIASSNFCTNASASRYRIAGTSQAERRGAASR